MMKKNEWEGSVINGTSLKKTPHMHRIGSIWKINLSLDVPESTCIWTSQVWRMLNHLLQSNSIWCLERFQFGIKSCSLAHQQTDFLILHQPALLQTRLGLSTARTGALVMCYCDYLNSSKLHGNDSRNPSILHLLERIPIHPLLAMTR